MTLVSTFRRIVEYRTHSWMYSYYYGPIETWRKIVRFIPAVERHVRLEYKWALTNRNRLPKQLNSTYG